MYPSFRDLGHSNHCVKVHELPFLKHKFILSSIKCSSDWEGYQPFDAVRLLLKCLERPKLHMAVLGAPIDADPCSEVGELRGRGGPEPAQKGSTIMLTRSQLFIYYLYTHFCPELCATEMLLI